MKIKHTKSYFILFTCSSWFSLVTVHDEAVPGSAEDATELRNSKSIGISTHCGNMSTERLEKGKESNNSEHHVTDEVSY